MPTILTVYEHQELRRGRPLGDGRRLDEALLARLARFAATLGDPPPWRMTAEGVRFQQLVGVVQVGDLVIEILPKVDVGREETESRWQAFLPDLLRTAGILPAHLPGAALQKLDRGGLLALLVDTFLEDVLRLARQGWVHGYRSDLKRTSVSLRGRVYWPEQLRRYPGLPLAWQLRVTEWSRETPANVLLSNALEVLTRLPLPSATANKVAMLQQELPPPNLQVQQVALDSLPIERRRDYARPLRVAQQIVQGAAPALIAGQTPALALLFDMNQLFEHYVFAQLQRAARPGMRVERQTARPFWRQHHLRPDIIIHYSDQRVVLDTKWKLLPHRQPGMEDLRQLYVYQRYFGAARGALVYPQPEGLLSTDPLPYAVGYAAEPLPYDCQLIFVSVQREGRLNERLGEEVLEVLGL